VPQIQIKKGGTYRAATATSNNEHVHPKMGNLTINPLNSLVNHVDMIKKPTQPQ